MALPSWTGAVVMCGLLLVVAAWLSRVEDWRSYSPV